MIFHKLQFYLCLLSHVTPHPTLVAYSIFRLHVHAYLHLHFILILQSLCSFHACFIFASLYSCPYALYMLFFCFCRHAYILHCPCIYMQNCILFIISFFLLFVLCVLFSLFFVSAFLRNMQNAFWIE